MISHWTSLHPTIAAFLVVALCLLVGYMERKVLGRVDIACFTWLFGLVVGSIALVGSQETGAERWILAAMFFVVGSSAIFFYYKKQSVKGSLKP